jgi:RNA polymerase sigma factor (sigma-70 family)
MALPSVELWFRDLADDDAGQRSATRASIDAARQPVSAVLHEDERHIVDQIRRGDRDVFTTLYTTYADPLARFALHLTGNTTTAEEVAAHVLAAIWMRHDRWEVHHGIDAYLFGAVRTRVLALRRDAGRHDRTERALADREISPTLGAPPPSPENVVEAEEWPERLHATMMALPERSRIVAFLRWKRGLDYDQIAHILGVNEATARQLVSRTVKAVRAMLGV